MNPPRSSSTSRKRVARVMIIDDHPVVRRGLALLIERESDLTIAGEMGSAESTRSAVGEAHPDVVLVDASLRGLSGLELLRRIRDHDAALPTIMLSMHDDVHYAVRAMHAGARGVVGRYEPAEALIEAIRCVRDGLVYLSDELAGRVDRLNSAGAGERYGESAPTRRTVGGRSTPNRRPPATMRSELTSLSAREFEVFRLMGQGEPPRQIAQRLRISPRTVETHRTRMKKKLGVKTMSHLMRLAFEWSHSELAM